MSWWDNSSGSSGGGKSSGGSWWSNYTPSISSSQDVTPRPSFDMGSFLHGVAGGVGSFLTRLAHNPVQEINNNFIKPVVDTGSRFAGSQVKMVGGALTGNKDLARKGIEENPFTPGLRQTAKGAVQVSQGNTGEGLTNIRQGAGKAGEQALNLASMVPTVKVAKGGLELGKAALKEAAKTGAKWGAGYGATTALQEKNFNPGTVAKDVAEGAAAGAATGAAVHGVTRGAARTADLAKTSLTPVNDATKVNLIKTATTAPEAAVTKGSRSAGGGFFDRAKELSKPTTPLAGVYNDAAKRLEAPAPTTYGEAGREAVKVVEGRQSAGKDFGKMLRGQIEKDVPSVDERRNLFHYLDGSVSRDRLAPETVRVADQIKPLLDTALRVRQEVRPNTNEIESYISHLPLNAEKGGTGRGGRFSDASGLSQGRTILKFTNGDETRIGTAEVAGLTRKPDGLYYDPAGNAWKASQATVQEKEAHTPIRYEKDAAKVMETYFNDTSRIKENHQFIQALKTDPQYLGKSVLMPGEPIPKGYRTVNVPGLDDYILKNNLADQVERIAVNQSHDPLLKTAYLKAEDIARRSIFYNFVVHPINMYAQAVRAAGRGKIFGIQKGPLGAVEVTFRALSSAAKSVVRMDKNFIAYKDAGAGMGHLGSQEGSSSFVEKLGMKLFKNHPEFGRALGAKADQANVIKGLYQANSKVVGFSDDVLRVALYDTLRSTDKNMTRQQAVKIGDKFMVDYGNTSNFEKNVVSRFVIFYPWLKGLTQDMVEMGVHPFANAGVIINTALGFAALSALQDGWRQYTGNPDAKVRYPGLFGLGRHLEEAPGQLAEGKMPSLANTHLAPLPKEIIQQLTNEDFFRNRPIVNPYDPQESQNALGIRLGHALNALIAPTQIGTRLSSGKSPTEVAINQVGLSAPHTKDHQAAPNLKEGDFLSSLNAGATKSGTGITNEPYDPIKSAIDKQAAKKLLDAYQSGDQSKLSAMQALKASGNSYFDKFFGNNPELDPTSPSFQGFHNPNAKQEAQDILQGGQDYKDSGGSKLQYMQAIKEAGFKTYDKFFAEHPELDPTSEKFQGYRGGGSSGYRRSSGFSPAARAKGQLTRMARSSGKARAAKSPSSTRLTTKLLKSSSPKPAKTYTPAVARVGKLRLK